MLYSSVILRNNNVIGRVHFSAVDNQDDITLDCELIQTRVDPGVCEVLCLGIVDHIVIAAAWTYKDCELFIDQDGKAKVRIGTQRRLIRKVQWASSTSDH